MICSWEFRVATFLSASVTSTQYRPIRHTEDASGDWTSHLARMEVAQAMTTLIDCWPFAETLWVGGSLFPRKAIHRATRYSRCCYQEGNRSYASVDEMEIADVLSRVHKLRVLIRSPTCVHLASRAWKDSTTDRPSRQASINECPRGGPPLWPTTTGFIGRRHVEKLEIPAPRQTGIGQWSGLRRWGSLRDEQPAECYQEGNRSYASVDEMEIADVLSRVHKLRVLIRSPTCVHLASRAWKDSTTDRPSRQASINECPRGGPPLWPTTTGFIGRRHVEKLEIPTPRQTGIGQWSGLRRWGSLGDEQPAECIQPVQKAHGRGPENHCPHQGYQRLSPLGPPSYFGTWKDGEDTSKTSWFPEACSVLAVDRCRCVCVCALWYRVLFLSNSGRDLKRHIPVEKRKGPRNL